MGNPRVWIIGRNDAEEEEQPDFGNLPSQPQHETTTPEGTTVTELGWGDELNHNINVILNLPFILDSRNIQTIPAIVTALYPLIYEACLLIQNYTVENTSQTTTINCARLLMGDSVRNNWCPPSSCWAAENI